MALRIQLRTQPMGWQLFRCCAVASLTATLFGVLVLLAFWAATDFDAEAGRQFGVLAVLHVVIFSAVVVLYYPWNPRWQQANGCRSPAPPDPIAFR